MSNKHEIFSNALKASAKQSSKTYRKIVPSVFEMDPSCKPKQQEKDPNDLWQGLWAQGEMVCLFGNQCVGKSILAMQIAKELQDKGLEVAYFALENVVYPIKPLINTISPSDDEQLTPSEYIDFIAQEINARKTQVAIIDDLSMLVDSSSAVDLRRTLNRLRIICQHNGTAMLLIEHSRKRKSNRLSTIDELQHPYEIMHACDSVFSLNEANRYNATLYKTSHYIKQHKNRMAPVIFYDDSVITAQLITNEDEKLIFHNLQHNGNERKLIRDNGFSSSFALHNAIAHYRQLAYSTREIAAIVGISQSQVSRISKNLQEKDTYESMEVDHDMQEKELEFREYMLNLRTAQQAPTLPKTDASDASDSNVANDASDSCYTRAGDVELFGDTAAKTKPVRNTNSSLKKLMKKSRRR